MALTVLKWLTLSVAIVLLSVLLFLSRNDFFISSGSDALTTIVRPALWAQVLSLLFVPLALYACLFSSYGKIKVALWSFFIVSLLVFSLGIHSFVIDSKAGMFRDVWGVVDVQQLSFDFVEGPSHDVTYETDLFWLNLYRGKSRVRIFLGIAPWRIDAESVMHTLLIPKPASTTQ